MVVREIPRRPNPSRRILLVVILLALLIGARSIAHYFIEFEWWKELGQLSTWTSMLLYGLVPLIVATLLAFVILCIGHARAMKFAGSHLSDYPIYGKLSSIALFLLSILIAVSSIDSWT